MDNRIPDNKDQQIQLVLNTGEAEEDTIDLGRVLHNARVRSRLYAWVLILCMAVGVCAPLLMYQFNHSMTTVASVVTLNYQVKRSWDYLLEKAESRAEKEAVNQLIQAGDESVLYEQVNDRSAPDGTELNLSQVTSSYVLQKALSGLGLPSAVNVTNLRNNITVSRILTEDSQRQQEVVSRMLTDKNSGAYAQAQEIELNYGNRFIVSLKNGFGDEDGSRKIELTDEELRILLDRILDAYNDYLVTTYADLKLPDDRISIIDTENTDILESLELLRTAESELYAWCASQPDNVKQYRSSVTGRTLEDWMEDLEKADEIQIEYLYSWASANAIARDAASLTVSYQYQLRTAINQLDEVNQRIASTQTILDSYKNDEIYVSMQESDTSRATSTTTENYNTLVLEQAANYATAAGLKVTISDLQKKIASLQQGSGEEDLAQAEEELTGAVNTMYSLYSSIREHMTEVQGSVMYRTYAEHSNAQGESKSFIAANIKNVIIGAAAGAIIACAVWFLAALAPEFRKKDEGRKEAPEA